MKTWTHCNRCLRSWDDRKQSQWQGRDFARYGVCSFCGGNFLIRFGPAPQPWKVSR